MCQCCNINISIMCWTNVFNEIFTSNRNSLSLFNRILIKHVNRNLSHYNRLSYGLILFTYFFRSLSTSFLLAFFSDIMKRLFIAHFYHCKSLGNCTLHIYNHIRSFCWIFCVCMFTKNLSMKFVCAFFFYHRVKLLHKYSNRNNVGIEQASISASHFSFINLFFLCYGLFGNYCERYTNLAVRLIQLLLDWPFPTWKKNNSNCKNYKYRLNSKHRTCSVFGKRPMSERKKL